MGAGMWDALMPAKGARTETHWHRIFCFLEAGASSKSMQVEHDDKLRKLADSGAVLAHACPLQICCILQTTCSGQHVQNVCSTLYPLALGATSAQQSAVSIPHLQLHC